MGILSEVLLGKIKTGKKDTEFNMEDRRKGKGAFFTGSCRVCGSRTAATAPTRYLLCQKCKLKGIRID